MINITSHLLLISCGAVAQRGHVTRRYMLSAYLLSNPYTLSTNYFTNIYRTRLSFVKIDAVKEAQMNFYQ